MLSEGSEGCSGLRALGNRSGVGSWWCAPRPWALTYWGPSRGGGALCLVLVSTVSGVVLLWCLWSTAQIMQPSLCARGWMGSKSPPGNHDPGVSNSQLYEMTKSHQLCCIHDAQPTHAGGQTETLEPCGPEFSKTFFLAFISHRIEKK